MDISRVNGIGNGYAYLQNHRSDATREPITQASSVPADAQSASLSLFGNADRLRVSDRNAADGAGKYQPNDPMLKLAKRLGIVECQTCKNRQYVDQSNDTGVSFKSARHISPEVAFAVVSAHEQEHVSIAQQEAAADENVSASSSVNVFTSICPECGRVYVSGGETRTTTVTHPDNPKTEKENAIPYLTETAFNPKTRGNFDAAA